MRQMATLEAAKGAFPWELAAERGGPEDGNVDKMSDKCLWSACKAISVGLLLIACGAAMATLGFYSDHLSTVEERRGNSTVLIKNENRDWQLDSLTYLGPMVMGLGGFIIVATCVMTFEARESRVSKLSWFKRTRTCVAPGSSASAADVVSSPGVQPDPPSDISWDRRSFFLAGGGRGSPSITTEQSNFSSNRRRRSSFGDIAPLHGCPSEPSLAHQVVSHLQLSSLSPGAQGGRRLFPLEAAAATAAAAPPPAAAAAPAPAACPTSPGAVLSPQNKALQSPGLLKPPRQVRSPRCSADLRQVLSFDCPPAASAFDSRPPLTQQNSSASQSSMTAELHLQEGTTRWRISRAATSNSPSGVIALPSELSRDSNAENDPLDQRRLSNTAKSDSTESRSLKTPSPAHRHHHRHHHHHHHRHGSGHEKRRLSSATSSTHHYRPELQRVQTIAIDSGLGSPPCGSSPVMSPQTESPSSPKPPLLTQSSCTVKRFPFVRQTATEDSERHPSV